MSDTIPVKDREFFLRKAEELINGQRAKDYGPAKLNHDRIAVIWNVLLNKKLTTPITAEDVTACMIGVKLARLAENTSHDDSWIDIIGYAALGGEIINE